MQKFLTIILKCYLRGDIEKSEIELLNKYKDTNILESELIKISHHGSISSSSESFLKVVNPKIALIGVGQNNKFGHPSNEVIKRLNQIGCEIYRTDKMGEIEVKISVEGKAFIKSHIINYEYFN